MSVLFNFLFFFLTMSEMVRLPPVFTLRTAVLNLASTQTTQPSETLPLMVAEWKKA